MELRGNTQHYRSIDRSRLSPSLVHQFSSRNLEIYSSHRDEKIVTCVFNILTLKFLERSGLVEDGAGLNKRISSKVFPPLNLSRMVEQWC